VAITGRTTLKARVLQGGTWSALVEAQFVVPEEFSTLQPTELSYHPPDAPDRDGDDVEFVELQNTGPVRLSLAGLRFTEGIDFEFADDAIAEPGAHVVLVRDPAAFAERFPGVAIAGVYAGRLDNGGEALALDHTGGFRVFATTYDDAPPWPAAADGLGASLQRASLDRRPDEPSAWVAAPPTPGSPFGGLVTDADGDGVPDAWERLNGTDPTRDDAGADPDADGFPNAAEHLAGTDPLDATSILRLEWLGLDGSKEPGEVRLAFRAAADRTYAVQGRTDLAGGSWTTILRVAAGPEPRRITVTDPAAGAAKSYRLVTPAPQ
jgi:hypothetical protein